MLRYRSDLRTLAFVAVYFVAFGAIWTRTPTSVWGVALAVVFLSWLSWVNAVITHNVIHSPVFRSRALNRALGFVLSLAYGFAVSDYIPGHNLSHHRYTQSRRDVMRTTKAPFRWHLLNLLLFFFCVAFAVAGANARYVEEAKTQHRAWYKQRTLEVILIWSVKIGLLLLDWKRALLFVGIPHLGAVWGITTVNLLQHDGCDGDHPYNHSRNFVGGLFNWFYFNNGYHGMHHEEPGLHWSLLPAAHEERIAPFVHPALEQRSLTLYVWKTFVWPGKRLRYDGVPVVIPAEGPDEDWLHAGDAAVLSASVPS
ncbi:MAG TPA: fatty acid desaturase [Polyangiaceae bacterium]|jgi:fatty acid desaturase